ncbi:MAG: flagellar basal body rod protein FlgB [Desulfovibrionaceae bacterium]
MQGITSQSQDFAEYVMDLQVKRQNIVMSNIANVDTPQYKSKEFHFENILQREMQNDLQGKISATSPSHFPKPTSLLMSTPHVTESRELRTIWGEDKVNLEKEMTNLAKINLKYSALSQIVRSGYTSIQEMIREVNK